MTKTFACWTVLAVLIAPGYAFSEDCKTCHDDKFAPKVTNPHPAATMGMCTSCHEAQPAHFEGNGGAMTTNRTFQTCYGCHERVDRGKVVHMALSASEDSCMTCHDPHGSNHMKVLRKAPRDLCLSCHDGAMFEGKSAHSMIKGSEASCVSCHAPHSAAKKALLKKEGPETCFACHDKAIKADKRTIPNMKEKVMNAPFEHRVVQTDCGFCHTPHASKFDRLLKDHFSTSNYNIYYPGGPEKPNTYALCFGCHSQGLMSRNITASDTKFRNDTQTGDTVVRTNLHWVHVTNLTTTTGPRFGKSCNLCHDVHGGVQEKMFRATTPSGTPLTFKTLERGGECGMSCHAPRTYQRLK